MAPLTRRKTEGPANPPRSMQGPVFGVSSANFNQIQAMKITSRDQIYGAVLRRIVRHEDVEAVKEMDDIAGHFVENEATHLLVKYATGPGPSWRFTFREDDIEVLMRTAREASLFGRSIVCLVCGSEVICALEPDEWSQILHLISPPPQQWIRADRAPRKSLDVAGTKARLRSPIAARRFPGHVLRS